MIGYGWFFWRETPLQQQYDFSFRKRNQEKQKIGMQKRRLQPQHSCNTQRLSPRQMPNKFLTLFLLSLMLFSPTLWWTHPPLSFPSWQNILLQCLIVMWTFCYAYHTFCFCFLWAYLFWAHLSYFQSSSYKLALKAQYYLIWITFLLNLNLRDIIYAYCFNRYILLI